MKKKPETTEKTRQAFIDVFCGLYAQKPIEKISVKEIADNSGYNRSTFYQYFSDIYELLDFVETDLLNYIKEELSKEEESSDTFQNMIHCFEEDSRLSALNALFGDYGSTRFLERLKREIPVEKWALLLPENGAAIPYLIEFYISTVLSMLKFWFRCKKDLPRDELFELIHNLYTGGISAVVSDIK